MRPFPVLPVLLLATVARAAEPPPRVPLRAPVSGAVVATLSREDGGFPFGFEAAAARAACLADPSVATSRALRGVLRLARRDRDLAYASALRLVRDCLGRGGWQVSFCGEGGGSPCPDRVASDGGADGLDENH